MTIQEFKKQAQKIEADPTKRVSAKVKEVLQRDNYVYDSHIHIFDKKSVPVIYFLMRFLKEQIAGNKEAEVLKAYDILENDAKYEAAEKLDLEKELGNKLINKELLDIVKLKSQEEILEYFHQGFSLNHFEPFTQKETIEVVLTMDLECGWGRKLKRDFREQVNDLHAIAEKKAILPFFALDPRRADERGKNNLYKLFIDAFTHSTAPYCGVKCYPALGYLPSDARLKPIFEICEEKNIPVFTHSGGTTISTFKKEIEVENSVGKRIKVPLPKTSRIHRANYLNSTYHWHSTLSTYPKLKINFAHFGSDYGWKRTDYENDSRIADILDKMQTFEGQVFTDYSYNMVEAEARQNFKNLFQKNAVARKYCMYGTDYWVVLPGNNLKQSIRDFLQELSAYSYSLCRTVPDRFLFNKEEVIEQDASPILAILDTLNTDVVG